MRAAGKRKWRSRAESARRFRMFPGMSMLFTFMSSFVFRRSLWVDRRERVLSWVGTYYIHMLTMHAALSEGATLEGCVDCLVLVRGGNPNEFNKMPGRFIDLDASAMARLITEIYGDALQMWQAIGRPFYRSYSVKSLIFVAANGGLNYLTEPRTTLLRLGYSDLLLKALSFLGLLKLLGSVKLGLDLRRAVLAKSLFQGTIT